MHATTSAMGGRITSHLPKLSIHASWPPQFSGTSSKHRDLLSSRSSLLLQTTTTPAYPPLRSATSKAPPRRPASVVGEMGQQRTLVYSFVARGTTVLADHAEVSGNFASVAAQCLQKLPSNNNRFNYNCDGHTFNYHVHDGFSNAPRALCSYIISMRVFYLKEECISLFFSLFLLKGAAIMECIRELKNVSTVYTKILIRQDEINQSAMLRKLLV